MSELTGADDGTVPQRPPPSSPRRERRTDGPRGSLRPASEERNETRVGGRKKKGSGAEKHGNDTGTHDRHRQDRPAEIGQAGGAGRAPTGAQRGLQTSTPPHDRRLGNGGSGGRRVMESEGEPPERPTSLRAPPPPDPGGGRATPAQQDGGGWPSCDLLFQVALVSPFTGFTGGPVCKCRMVTRLPKAASTIHRQPHVFLLLFPYAFKWQTRRAWWRTPLIPALGRQRQADF